MADEILGSIPPLSAWEGEKLSFTVKSTLSGTVRFTKRAIPSPKGRTSIDEKTGLFTYEPAAEDKDEFAVWIRARAGAKEESQKVYITPHPKVPSDFNVIEHASDAMPDPEQESLVRHLVGAPEDAKSPMMNFRPGAWAKLAVKRSGDEGLKIKSLTLEVYYVFQNINDRALRTVAVRVLDDAQPYIRCDAEDANGRSDGVGSFLRTFQKNKNQVTLLAPSRYGSRPFRGWRVGGNAGEAGPVAEQELTKGQSLKLDLLKSPDYIVEPVFAPVTETPVNDRGEEWPACPAGWVFDDWLFVNGTRSELTIDRIVVGLRPGDEVTALVNVPQGGVKVKLSFERLKLLPGEATKLSVCLSPDAAPTANKTWSGWRAAGDFYYVGFGVEGTLTGFAKGGRGAPDLFDIDRGNRVLTFART
jgi:hypothetical protein